MTEKVCLVYWCTGTGHAARMIPVAKEFESCGINVSVAGGGFGRKFVEMNGFEHPGLTEVDDPAEYSKLEFIPRFVKDILPSAVRRTAELRQWMKKEEPEKVVTDDVFAMISAATLGVEFHRIDHLTPEMLPLQWKIPQKIYNSVSMIFGEQIIVTSLWPWEEGSENITRVGPLGQEGEADGVDEYDVLISPGSWGGEEFQEIRKKLEEEGYDVRTVGDENWETRPAMTPYIEAADCVICTGYSSIADTVVAGTPCIVYPFLPFQKAIADGIDERRIEGLNTVGQVAEAVQKAVECVEEECENPEYENGAPEFVDEIL
jgi:hypothetical protein